MATFIHNHSVDDKILTDINMILLTFLSEFIFSFLKTIKKYWNLYQFSKTVPGPPVKELFSNTGPELFPWFEKLRDKYGSTFRLWLGKDLFVFFSDPDDIKAVLSSNNLLYKSPNYELVGPWLGKGLLTNGGPDWHQKRKLLTPAFHFKILGRFKEPIEQSCDIMIKRLEEVADGKVIDIYPYITLHALDSISETAMGIAQHIQENENSEFAQATQLMCKIYHELLFSRWKRIPFLYKFTADKKLRDKTIATLHNETKRVIQLRRDYLIKEKIDQIATEDEFGVKERLAFIDILLLSQMRGNNLTDKNIQEEVDTFMFEGHDTTSWTLSFTIYLLSVHPGAQEKAREEAIQMNGKESETMKYMEAVIKESLRLYPIVPSFTRQVMEPIEIGGRIYPVGCSIGVHPYLIHRDPKIYENPKSFIPERFLRNQEYHPYAFIGFSAGPRNCIGQKFAMLEMKCTLSKLLRAFDILPAENFEPIRQLALVMKTTNGIEVRLRKRKN